MLDEVLAWLAPRRGMTLVDGTLGGGGHTRALAELVGDDGQIVAFDRDPAALAAAERNLRGLPIKLVHADYAELPQVLGELGLSGVDGVVLDLGLSSDQLNDADRGFSFDAAGPLDLRFDTTIGEPAWKLIDRFPERELADIIYRFGEERYSRRIARRIVERRRTDPVGTAAELARLVRSCVPRSPGHSIDAATRTFQALRIAVNGELASLERMLRVLPDCLTTGGRVAIISFHSLEDRLVKTAFRDDPRYEALVRKPVRPSEAEVARNPRARSAKLRVAARV
jgi:16S rRNA (cytosine1402-N4)-methyltransferase